MWQSKQKNTPQVTEQQASERAGREPSSLSSGAKASPALYPSSSFTPINVPTTRPTPSPPSPGPERPTPPPPTRPFPLSLSPRFSNPDFHAPGAAANPGTVLPRETCTLSPSNRRHQIQSEINVIVGRLDEYARQAEGRRSTEELDRIRAMVGPLLDRRDWLWSELRETYRVERGLGSTPAMEEKVKERERKAEGKRRAAEERRSAVEERKRVMMAGVKKVLRKGKKTGAESVEEGGVARW